MSAHWGQALGGGTLVAEQSKAKAKAKQHEAKAIDAGLTWKLRRSVHVGAAMALRLRLHSQPPVCTKALDWIVWVPERFALLQSPITAKPTQIPPSNGDFGHSPAFWTRDSHIGQNVDEAKEQALNWWNQPRGGGYEYSYTQGGPKPGPFVYLASAKSPVPCSTAFLHDIVREWACR
ncbi:uncharacterized protein Triagg1_6707 [Trichoderma aggressivum f. europaeum]|uniref:Uncharacterized protein n=1 Tax=Trichoderma aggressivum f. europaeum TaxID=173218 RepID=A0AAE1LYF0_9HYPO|nr:hypothetical protein Triagg1_6707 [Trichoderma aggressivum f. europaeum]